MSENFISSTMQLENLEKEKIDSVEETQMDYKTLNKKKNKKKMKKMEKAADEVTEDGNRKSAESEKKKKKKKKKKREIEESLEKSVDGAHKMNEKGGKMESLSSEANGNGGKKRKGAVADGDAGTDTKKRNINGQKDGETTDRVKPSSEKVKKATTKDIGAKDKKATTKKKRETEESLEKSADGAHKKNEKGRKMESLSSEANGNGGKKRKGAVADGDGGTDMKKRNINRQKDGETTDRVKPSSEKAKKATTKDKGAEKGKEEKKSKKLKKVTFAGEVDMLGDKLVRGKRFSKEEDQLIRDAVYKYIDKNQLGENGLEMVLKCSKHSKQVKGCWKEIGAAIPGRPYTAIYYRAHIIFERSEKRGFSEEEMEFIKKFHAKNGPNWKRLSELLGKQRVHVKDAWRRIRLPNRKKGRWSQDEYQSLFDLVNLNLRMKAFEDKKPDIPIVKGKSDSTKRENIFWEAISDKLSTRTMSCCCHKWYDQLTSPLVRDGVWADTDDYLLLDALQKQDGCSVDDVDWDSLIDGRSGEVCQRRWEEMLRHLGGYRERTFIEQLDVLTKRYCGDMLQYRFRHGDGDGDEEEKDE